MILLEARRISTGRIRTGTEALLKTISLQEMIHFARPPAAVNLRDKQLSADPVSQSQMHSRATKNWWLVCK